MTTVTTADGASTTTYDPSADVPAPSDGALGACAVNETTTTTACNCAFAPPGLNKAGRRLQNNKSSPNANACGAYASFGDCVSDAARGKAFCCANVCPEKPQCAEEEVTTADVAPAPAPAPAPASQGCSADGAVCGARSGSLGAADCAAQCAGNDTDGLCDATTTTVARLDYAVAAGSPVAPTCGESMTPATPIIGGSVGACAFASSTLVSTTCACKCTATSAW